MKAKTNKCTKFLTVYEDFIKDKGIHSRYMLP